MKSPKLEIEGHAIKVSLEKDSIGGPTQRQIDDWMEAVKGGFETEELRSAFRTVANKSHWKSDIDAVVPAKMREILARAIPFHTGGDGVIFEDLGDGMLRVTAPGYWSNGMEG